MQAMGFNLRWRAQPDLTSVEAYRRAALRRLPKMAAAYVDGGADDMVTLRGNRTVFDQWQLNPSVLAGHHRPDLSTVIAGRQLSMPVMLAPTGATGITHWRGDVAAVRAADACGTQYSVSTASSWSLEEVAAATPHDHSFQLYPGVGGTPARLMHRAWAAGYRTLVVTVDVPTKGNREAERREGMDTPPVLTPRRALNFARHPRWTYDVLRHSRLGGRNYIEGGDVSDLLATIEIQEREMMLSSLTWPDIEWMREVWKGRLFLKGILSAEDAERAVQAGVDGIVVSNHGGRQLDTAPPSLAVLPEIAAQIDGRAEIVLDSGVRRGTDVVKALALGADAVMIGRPYLYGLAVGGEAGVVGVLEVFREEIARTLTLLGVRSVADLDHTHLRPAPA